MKRHLSGAFFAGLWNQSGARNPLDIGTAESSSVDPDRRSLGNAASSYPDGRAWGGHGSDRLRLVIARLRTRFGLVPD
jgi:hypothetical protein